MDLTAIGNRVRVARKGKMLTQEKLAELADVTPHYIYEIEHGLKAMSLDTLEKVSLALDLSLDYLFGGDDMSAKGESTPASDSHLNAEINRLSRTEKLALINILSGIIARLKNESK
ncbi:MAG: helix-turn-helix domain-containing protein [Lachnospiraceae bacterium]|nr:helix-turn-helix domain-containing protein [Lachnospiraceae bacterium]